MTTGKPNKQREQYGPFSGALPPHVDNQTLYETHVAPLIRGVVENGACASVIAYGASGTGKTFTLQVRGEGHV